MADAINRRLYNRQEKQFIEEGYCDRLFQKAKESGKVICVHCYEADGSIKFFSLAGVDVHYRRAHKRCCFKEENSLKLFTALHFEESKLFINELSAFRSSNSLGLNLFEEYEVKAEHLRTSIYSTCKKEAAKLAGLVLSHGNYVNPSLTNGYPLSVIKVGDAQDFEEKFLVWKASTKIYVESVYYREMPLKCFDELPLQDMILNEDNDYHRPVEGQNPDEILKNVFGHSSFRPGQKEAMNAVLQQKGAVVVIPTGGGKTVIYTIPTLLMPGITVVVSPLLMLMHDQLLKLREKGINTCYINSMLTKESREEVISNLCRPDSEYKVLLTSPEVLMSQTMQTLLQKLKCERRLNFFAIDEAHCIDTWGADLRPEYQELGALKKYGVPIVALTGTATALTIEQIKSTLKLLNPEVIKLPFVRKNVIFEVFPKKPGFSATLNQVVELINSRFSGQCGIVYCSRREDTSQLSLELKMNGISSIYYHGGIVDPEIKLKHANLWLDGNVNVMCATNSFGMGIDKQDVRFVIHLTFPASYETYAQESGRAGRDGIDAHCIVFYRFEDRNFHLHNITKATLPDARSKRLKSLNEISNYLMDNVHCLQKIMAEYFGSTLEGKCGKCGNCLNPVIPVKEDCTLHAKQLITCLQHMQSLKDKVSVNELGSTYIGSKSAAVKSQMFDQVPEYGKEKGHFKTVGQLTCFINHLIISNVFTENLRDEHDKVTSTYLSVGNIREILSESINVMF